MIKVFVFDTNSIISAHLLPASISRQAYSAALEHGVVLHSEETLNELTTTFSRPKFDRYITVERRADAMATFQNKSYLIEVEEKVNVCRDVKDNKFLDLALAAQADCLVTGDKDLLILHPFQNIPILSPADFINSFLQTIV